MATKVAYVALVKNFGERTWRVSLRDEFGGYIVDDTGEYEMSDHAKTIADKEAKRLAKFYNVEVRTGDKA